MIKRILATLISKSGCIQLMSHVTGRRHIILTFHRVRSKGSQKPVFDTCPSVDIETFRRILIFAKEHYRIKPLRELVKNLNSRQPLAAITFDDGWRDNYEIAYPVLREFNMPATIFVTTGKIGSSEPFWQQRLGEAFRIHSQEMGKNAQNIFKEKIGLRKTEQLNQNTYKRTVDGWKNLITSDIEKLMLQLAMPKLNGHRLFLNINEIQEMANNKIEFGSHTMHHVILTRETEESLDNELFKSKKMLQKIVGKPVLALSYPNGNYSPHIISKAISIGYKIGVTTFRRRTAEKDKLLELPRIDAEWDEIEDISINGAEHIFKWVAR